jgi:bifunctional non-homologous end joining protein LigD
MALKEYQAKRKFERTPEPAGRRQRGPAKPISKAKQEKALRFVVQKHDASHLHYDFRLELDGVLKSWAIPKGPSLKPEDKRLAMQVEDHPFEYQHFEGVIPEGNYGAGTVMVWDAGEYYVAPGLSRAENEKKLREGLEAGKLTFTLKGHKLQGAFSLIHMKGNLRYPKENSWLLIKADDEFASKQNILADDRSVLTDRNLDEITREETPPAGAEKSPAITLDPSLEATMPHHIKPMLATLVDHPFNRPDWFFEIKWDGYRAIAEVRKKKKAELYSRNLLSFENKFPLIFQELQKLDGNYILDGEIVALDDAGKPSFQLLQDYENNQQRLVYYVFDLLYIDKYDICRLPLWERKQLLQGILPSLSRIFYCDHVETEGVSFFEAAVAQDLEGIIAKDAQSPYLEGKRSSYWLKMKTRKRQEAIICGFTAPRGGRKNLGALILGMYDAGKLKYIGHTGTGMDTKTLKSLHEQLTPLIIPASPFEKTPKTNEKPTWVKPELVCEVAFTEWTHDGNMRHPVYLGLRTDKPAEEVCMETEKPVEKTVPKSGSKTGQFAKEAPGKQKQMLTIHRHKVTLSNPERVLWPKLNIRKKDLVNYYRSVAPYILPYLKDRPYVMHRFPEGVTGESFYQKDVIADVPKWVERIEIFSESNQETIHYVICQNEETLVWLANLACIEMNPWNSRRQNLENPDWAAIDLDPQGIGFNRVIEAAQVVHQILEDWNIPNYCKTSGATGLHIYVPLAAQYSYDTARDFAHMVAMLAHQELPKTTSLERSPSKRTHQIYLDYLQNRYGQTLVSPYSVRPTPEATVSTPLLWEEVKPGLLPTQFTINNIAERLDDVGDLWKPVMGPGVNLKKLLNRMSEQSSQGGK